MWRGEMPRSCSSELDHVKKSRSGAAFAWLIGFSYACVACETLALFRNTVGFAKYIKSYIKLMDGRVGFETK